MTKKKTTDGSVKETEYRIFNLPGYGRVRAPVTMTEKSLIEALTADDPVAAPK